jgi:cytochrome c biogenesis protein
VDHIVNDEPPISPAIGVFGWLRWTWRQLTSMRTALILLLLMAAAAVPGSIYPQRSADPNGVTTYFQKNPQLAQFLDKIQIFDVYTSAWFSAIYILLFVSLIGCVLPRTAAHFKALRAYPPEAPKNLKRMPAHQAFKLDPAQGRNTESSVVALAQDILKRAGYRVLAKDNWVAAERGYWRETGNLMFHISLVGVLIAVGFGGAYSYSGQRVVVEGETFVNNLAGYDSFSPGLAFKEDQLVPFSATLDKFDVVYDLKNKTNLGTPLDFAAKVTVRQQGSAVPVTKVIRVNQPLELPKSNIYLTGNGYAPVITIHDGEGNIAFSGPVVYLPQDKNMTSLGVIKVPDAKPSQFGILSFLYPTAAQLKTKAFTSGFPAPINPLLTMNVYEGDLGLDSGIPSNVFSLEVHGLKQLTGGKTGVEGIKLVPGETADLPNGLGTVSFDGLRRYASLDVTYNPGQFWVLLFAMMSLSGLIMSLLIPRRRVWVRETIDGFEIAALARGDDPGLNRVITEVGNELIQELTGTEEDETK